MNFFKTLVFISIVAFVSCRGGGHNVTPVVVCDQTSFNTAFPQLTKGSSYERAKYLLGTAGYKFKVNDTDSIGNAYTYYQWALCAADTTKYIRCTFANDSLKVALKTTSYSLTTTLCDSVNFVNVVAGLPTVYRTYVEVKSLMGGIEGDNIYNAYFYKSIDTSYYNVADSTQNEYRWYNPNGGYINAVFQGPRLIWADQHLNSK